MLSMTGYGRGEYKEGGIELTAEVKTVNNRYLDVSVKCPRLFVAYEDVMRSIVREKLTRGHADVFIGFSDKRDKQRSLYLDESTATAYAEAARRIKSLFRGRFFCNGYFALSRRYQGGGLLFRRRRMYKRT